MVLAAVACLIAVWFVGCATNPVKGWTMVWSGNLPQLNEPELNHSTYKPNKVVVDDCNEFLKQSGYPGWLVESVSIYEDKTGRHGVAINIETGPRRYTIFYLMYDKADKKTKVIKGATTTQFHM